MRSFTRRSRPGRARKRECARAVGSLRLYRSSARFFSAMSAERRDRRGGDLLQVVALVTAERAVRSELPGDVGANDGVSPKREAPSAPPARRGREPALLRLRGVRLERAVLCPSSPRSSSSCASACSPRAHLQLARELGAARACLELLERVSAARRLAGSRAPQHRPPRLAAVSMLLANAAHGRRDEPAAAARATRRWARACRGTAGRHRRPRCRRRRRP